MSAILTPLASTLDSEETRVHHVCVQLPKGDTAIFQIQGSTSMLELLQTICGRQSLDSATHSLRILFQDGTIVDAENDRKLSEYASWELFILHSKSDETPLNSNSNSVTTQLIPHRDRLQSRRKSTINAYSSRGVVVRPDAEAFPKTLTDAAELELNAERVAKSQPLNATISLTPKKSSALRALSTIFLRSSKLDFSTPMRQLDDKALSPPRSGASHGALKRTSAIEGTSLSVESNVGNTLERKSSGTTTFADAIKSCDSEDVRTLTRRAIQLAINDRSSTPPGSPSMSPIRTSRPRSSTTGHSAFRRSPVTSPNRARLTSSGCSVEPSNLGHVGIYSGSAAAAPLQDEPDMINIKVYLPSMTALSIKVLDCVTLESLLLYVCEAQGLQFTNLSLEVLGSPTVLELDRTIKYYYDKEKATSYNLVTKPKSYHMLCLSENGADVLLLQYAEGRLIVMAVAEEKILEIVTMAPDFYELTGVERSKRDVDHLQPTFGMNQTFLHASAPWTLELEDYDYAFLDTFLMTYRSFMKPVDVFDELISRFNSELPETWTPDDADFYAKQKVPCQFRCVQAIGIWVDNYWNDFAINNDLKNDLHSFLTEIQQHEQFRDVSTAIQDIIKRKSAEYDRMLADQKIAISKSKTMESMLSAFASIQVAQQLCLYTWRLFRNIHPIEYLGQIWLKKDTEESYTPSLDYFISRFDLESYWVATEICSVKDIKKRAMVVIQFIEIAKFCLDMNNFFSTFSLLSGLGMRAVERLKKTWKLVPPEAHAKYQMLVKLCDPSKNMKNYRDRLAIAKPPIIPFLPIYLKDLTFLNDGNPSRVRGLVNFDKLRMISKRVHDIVLSRGTHYEFVVVPQIQNYLKKPPVEREVDRLMELSNELEPKKS